MYTQSTYNLCKTTLVLYGLFFTSFLACDKPSTSEDLYKSVDQSIATVQNSNLPNTAKKETIAQAIQYLKELPSSERKLKKLKDYTYQAHHLQDSLLFFKLNQLRLEEAERQEDTLEVADAHWSYGSYYLEEEDYEKAFYHYTEAQKGFSQNRHPYYEAKMWYNLAFIKGRLKDYTTSETYIYKALPTFLQLHKKEQLYRCYTLLGFLYKELEGFDRAHAFHQQALQYLPEKDDKFMREAAYNNIGLLWHRQGTYTKAIDYYNQALTHQDLAKKKPALYARLLDNRAYSQLQLKHEERQIEDFQTALKIRDSIENREGVIINRLHIAEWHLAKGDTLTALSYAKQAHQEAHEIQLKKELLSALKLLAKIDLSHAAAYMTQWQDIQNELQRNLRHQRNKVAQIQFNTQQYRQQNLKLSKQKRILILVCVGVILIGLLLFFMIRQQYRYKKLEQQRQKEQELQQEREHERYRIAEDLHDGVLGKLFGLRMQWGMLKIQGSASDKKEHAMLLGELQKIEKEIREISHNLKKATKDSFYQDIEKLLAAKSELGNFSYQCDLAHHHNKRSLSAPVKEHLLAITEEILQNTIKHAAATHVTLACGFKNKTFYLSVVDNGKGFLTHQASDGIGLQNIQDRINKIGGDLNLKSSIGDGTAFYITVPTQKLKS
ncbi:tetratricopeptide repeat-containing sensor histidine kinase [Mesonia sp. K7]|uniref:tetratricopeptide repeat-containing sensor histidine kinase n=1 Tax=Mesonia sp. K7 TaxID=2218606 RepID=UPI000DA9C474|nr:tetratricopeptide repeat-containing sensor histidine kinase [Mesonia sp. K7]PZD76440.1 hypothetical protein DNG35_11980 [Mesonia sp. K7]